jgi:hypothetical protein
MVGEFGQRARGGLIATINPPSAQVPQDAVAMAVAARFSRAASAFDALAGPGSENEQLFCCFRDRLFRYSALTEIVESGF